MKKNIFIALTALLALICASCEDILDRPQLNSPTDENFWKSESDLRLYANGFYPNYFVGYGVSWSEAYSPYRGYTFNDDLTGTGKQSAFTNSVPSSMTSTSAAAVATWQVQYSGPSWNFSWIRKANIMIDRIENNMKGTLSTEAYNHWLAVAKFFKCYSYCRLVEVYGDVPYFESTLSDADLESLYKDRDSRIVVMDKVYDMLKNDILPNMRTNDGANMLNRYVAAAFASRWMLFEGTWQKYHGGDQAAAKKYLELARDAAEMVINSGNYAIDTPLRELFGSENLAGNKEAIIYRHFDAGQSITHCVASYSNGNESQTGANLAFLKSVICQDGKPYKTSALDGAKNLDMKSISRTRDPRFEATFIDTIRAASSTLVYSAKFVDRACIDMTVADMSKVAKYNSMTNTNDAPVIRYGEVLLNWIEAKAELALLGGAAVTQADIDKSINVLRDRPLDDHAKAKGLKNTAHMVLADINGSFDPDRDPTVDPLVWEVRRERRLEMVNEHSRILDLRRWMKLDYMNNTKYPDTMLGPWVDFTKEGYASEKVDGVERLVSQYLVAGNVNKLHVMKADGSVVYYDGTNGSEMVGYYIPTNCQPRDAFDNRVYLCPLGKQEIDTYSEKGHTLTQNPGW